ncbi:entericidin A/B family lipoprotein [Telmatospirillum sp. J64-1]|uniref:entericidin A/B family lipoprotein n=1 Tax=Telmatospirillum sp. J64-1 TaxID=2502183 RepID=UPI002102D3F2|nr:entericidin A/B family lipoprotein [Telmatospirillum sp. J64-1]
MEKRKSRSASKAVRMDNRAYLVPFTVVMFLAAALLSGCNTMAGLGEDTQAAGRAVEGQARDVQR